MITLRGDSAFWPQNSVLVRGRETCHWLSFGTLYIIDAWERIQCHERSYVEERTEKTWFLPLENFQDGCGIFVSQYTCSDWSTGTKQALPREVWLILGKGERKPRKESLTEVIFKFRCEGEVEIGQVENKGRRRFRQTGKALIALKLGWRTQMPSVDQAENKVVMVCNT